MENLTLLLTDATLAVKPIIAAGHAPHAPLLAALATVPLALRLLILGVFDILINLPFGAWRVGCRKFSVAWFVAIHAPIPLLILIRIWLGLSVWFIPISVACAVLGQLIGGRLRSGALKKRGELNSG